jgi:ArsR family transcriptional regulator, arsenate/arsenite/antimonite-responsive transcriptional repressor
LIYLPAMPLASTRETTAQVFHALSDPTRLQLVELLRHGERCFCDLTGALDAAQSRLSFLLKVLKEAGLVTDRREGRWIYYELRREAFEELGAMLSDLEPHRPSKSGRACCP